MTPPDHDRVFAGSVPQAYDRHLVPLIFEPYAVEMAERVASRKPERVLEVAAGTGAVTAELARRLPRDTVLVATDLNQPMLDEATAKVGDRPVEWRQADALALPFPDQSFDLVACQFGVMFFPDRPKAYAEARRVLRPGGLFLFNTWDRVSQNDLADLVGRSLAPLFPEDPPRFLERRPYGYFDKATIGFDLVQGGFTDKLARMTTVTLRSRAPSALGPAIGYCQGTPLRGEIEARDPAGLDRATGAAVAAIEERFGTGPIDAKIQAHVIEAER